ncbi:hypothetical protein, partial [Massilia sp. PWRC2]|uniref:hypothetical protein n=1 Tax=Massilia sp. PWRC2 TaxID=2804626 RepID=UPI003CF66FF4
TTPCSIPKPPSTSGFVGIDIDLAISPSVFCIMRIFITFLSRDLVTVFLRHYNKISFLRLTTNLGKKYVESAADNTN